MEMQDKAQEKSLSDLQAECQNRDWKLEVGQGDGDKTTTAMAVTGKIRYSQYNLDKHQRINDRTCATTEARTQENLEAFIDGQAVTRGLKDAWLE